MDSGTGKNHSLRHDIYKSLLYKHVDGMLDVSAEGSKDLWDLWAWKV